MVARETDSAKFQCRGEIMDPTVIDLTTKVMAILLPFVSKGAEEFASKVGDAAFEKAKSILSTLRTKWSGDEEALDGLAHFEEKPARYKAMLEDILQEKLAKDKDLSATLSRLLQEMGPTLEVVQTMEESRGVTGLRARTVHGGTVKVSQDAKIAENTVGIDITDSIG